MYKGYLYNHVPGVHTGLAQGAPWKKKKTKKIFSSETTRPRAFIFYMWQCVVILFLNPVNHAYGSKMALPWGSLAPIDLQWEKHANPANHAPWVKNVPTSGVISSNSFQWEKHKKNLLLRNHKAQIVPILCVAMYKGIPY